MSSGNAEAGLGPDTGFRELRSERLVLRRFLPGDAPSLAGYRSDPAVASLQTWKAPFTEDQARRFIDDLATIDPDTPGEWFQFAVVEGSSGVHVGDVAALVDPEDTRQVVVGITLARAAQGQGYATEALTMLLDYLFLQRGKHRVIAECDPRNQSAVRLLKRLGMRREAHHVESLWLKGEWVDEYVYAMLGREWVARRSQRDNEAM
jgi:RimJ/RimL family protein N-acetyltransferase